jgi:hypothetical protein
MKGQVYAQYLLVKFVYKQYIRLYCDHNRNSKMQQVNKRQPPIHTLRDYEKSFVAWKQRLIHLVQGRI